jgi:hypothetical protein
MFGIDHSALVFGAKLFGVQLLELAKNVLSGLRTAIPPFRTWALNQTHLTGVVSIHEAQSLGELAFTHYGFPVVRFRDASLRPPGSAGLHLELIAPRSPHPLPQCALRGDLLRK